MIISEARKKFDGETIALSDWLLAPLYLQRGSTYWIAHRPAIAAQNKTIYEVIFTTIDETHWDNLWKLKLTTEDEPGVARRVCDVLEEFKIRVLTAECSVHSLNRYNSMSFILSMQKYDHHLDGFHQDLANPETVRVAYLELSLLSAMASSMVFHRNGRPRFELIPMRLHSYFRREGFDHSQELAGAMGKGSFALQKDICRDIRHTCGDGDIYYSGAVDTENRLIRILFFPQGMNGVAHMQVSGGELGTSAIRRVLSHFEASEANILRFQIRRGLNKRYAARRLATRSKGRASKEGAGRFDLTFEASASASEAGKVVEAIRSAIKKDADLKGIDIYASEPTD